MSEVEELRARLDRIEAEALAGRQAFAMLVAMLRGLNFNGRALVAFLLDAAGDPEKLARIGGLNADAEALRQHAKMALELILDVEGAPKPTHDGPASRQ